MCLMWRNTLKLISLNKQKLSIPLFILCSGASPLILWSSENLSNMYIIVPVDCDHCTLRDRRFCKSTISKSIAGFSNRLQNISNVIIPRRHETSGEFKNSWIVYQISIVFLLVDNHIYQKNTIKYYLEYTITIPF